MSRWSGAERATLLVDRRHMLAAVGAVTMLGGCGPRRETQALRASITGKGASDTRLLLASARLKPDFAVEYSEFQSGNLVVEAFNGGSLDYGGMSEIPPIFAAASDIHSFRQIAVLHGDVNNQVVLVPRGSTIRTLADLKGKRVGYVRATTTHYFLIRMLTSVGLGWDDIRAVAMNVTDGATAFSHGALDAWAIYGFPIQRALAEDGARVLKTALGFLSGNYVVTASVAALADAARVEQIRSYLKLMRRAYAWADTHQDEWAQTVAKAIGVPLPYVQDEFRQRSASTRLEPVNDAAITSQQQVADTFARARLVPPVDVRPLWDDRFNDLLSQEA